jgi:hypothetical protein
VPPGYEQLSYTVRIKGSGTKEEFAEIHEAVMATSPTSTTCPGPLTSNPPSSSVIDGSERRRGLQTSCVVLASNDVSLGSMPLIPGLDVKLSTTILAGPLFSPW